MSKDKKADGPLADQSQAGEVGVETPTSSNGEPKAPPIRKSWSSPIQVMAKVEQMMRDLTDEECDLVSYFFHKQYCKSRQP